MQMTLVRSIKSTSALYGSPVRVFLGYVGGVKDSPEFVEARRKSTSPREVPWADAEPALVAIGRKPAPVVRVDTESHTLFVMHDGNGWRVDRSQNRLG